MENTSEQANDLPVSKVVQIDKICDQFDRAINEAIKQDAPWPSLEKYLADSVEPV
jgi:hypothetical protein